MSQAIHSLSCPSEGVVAIAATGSLQWTASAEWLTATDEPPPPKTSDAASQVRLRRSYVMTGSLARGARACSKPRFQVRPRSREVAKPMLRAPPSKIRPTWKTATTVFPEAKESGSTSVSCWLSELR